MGRLSNKKKNSSAAERRMPPALAVSVEMIRWVLMVILPAAAFYLMELYEHDPFVEVRELARWYNIFLFELIAWILFFVTGRAKWALRILWLCAMVFGLTNHYVMEFRSTPFVPWDLFSVRTAASVAGNYDFAPDGRVVAVTLAFLAGIGLFAFMDLRLYGGRERGKPLAGRLLARIRRRSEVESGGTAVQSGRENGKADREKENGEPDRENAERKTGRFLWLWRFLPALVLFLVLSSFVSTLQDEEFQTSHQLYPFLFTPSYMTKVNGMAVTFAMDLAYVIVEKPSGYSESAEEELMARYTEEAEEKLMARCTEEAEAAGKAAVKTGGLPNIIVIMDEAFSDLGVLGDAFTTSVDCMPFVHMLQSGHENTITGMLNVSVCGGNTANTEFEFLTGNSMAFLPAGSIPYQQYVKSELPSLASWLKELGYATSAIHPYNAAGWSRDKVYPLLGFDEFYSLKTFVNPLFLRSYVSDASDFEKVIEICESGEEGTPQFIFNVTMQNHGSYTEAFDNFEPDVTTNAGENFALRQYLALIRRSDLEFERLVDYFAGQEERTVVVFFGDHQPADAVARPVWSVNGVDDRALTTEQELLRYQVPYVVWANYDIGSASGQDTSVNYLAAQVLEAAGVPLSDYQLFLSGLREELPLISAVRRVGSEEAADEYQKLQYYQMFDRK